MQSSDLENQLEAATETPAEISMEPAKAQIYKICIKGQNYSFSCTDGEGHVRKLETKINEVIETLDQYETGHILTDYAVKIVLLLADKAVRADQYSNSQEVQERFDPLLEELDRVLIST